MTTNDMNNIRGVSNYQVMPPLSEGEYEALREQIAANGVLVPVVRDQHGNLLDGHHRLQIAQELGVKYRVDIVTVEDDAHARSLARSYNLARRHLNREQKRQLIADEIAADPSRSNRHIGRLLGVDHKTVGSVRREVSGEIPHPQRTYSERDLAEMLVGVIVSRYEHAETRDEQKKWALPLNLCDEILQWAAGGSNLVWFAKIASSLYALDADAEVWEVMAPWLVEIAKCALDECGEVRAERGADNDWRLPGERLAELTIALWSADIPADLRPAVYRSLEGPLCFAVAEVAEWWPVPRADTVISGAATVLAHVARQQDVVAAGGTE